MGKNKKIFCAGNGRFSDPVICRLQDMLGLRGERERERGTEIDGR